MDDENANVSQALDKLLRLKKVEHIGLGRSARFRRSGGFFVRMYK